MKMNRRAVLKTLAAAPTISLLSGLSGCGGGPYVNILLHGLFMMEFNENKLVIATPKFDGHEFGMRYHGKTATDLPELVSLEGLVKAGQQKTFASENLQFPASDIGSGYRIDYQNPSKHNHRCTMVLPLPYNILGLRADDKDKFKDAAADGSIKQDILASSSSKLATITCIQYKPADGAKPFVVNYYAEHKSVTVDSVNDALKTARDVCGNGFNLQMKALAKPPAADTTFPQGVDQTDEEPLVRHLDVASCPQFGING